MSYFSFNRPLLAQSYCASLEGAGIIDARSGLFLAGPRRVGKSTFLIDDLIPEAESRGWVTVYVDLWANKDIDPADLIAESIKNKILSFESRLAKFIKTVRLDKVNVMGTFTLDLTKSGLPDNVTLTDALRVLHQMVNKPVLLMIDEAQQALLTQHGMSAMFAIKSARDQMNSPQRYPALMLVFTGSHRDKLTHLTLKKDQPFYGSDVISFPLLDRAFTDELTEWVNQNLAVTNQFTKESVWEAFKLTGHRPEILRSMIGRIAISGEAKNFTSLLHDEAQVWHGRAWEELESNYRNLTSLQQAILTVMVNKGVSWSPFSEDSIRQYCQIAKLVNLSTASVQAAIQSLRERNFIWQSGRGAYTLEDETLGVWLKRQQTEI